MQGLYIRIYTLVDFFKTRLLVDSSISSLLSLIVNLKDLKTTIILLYNIRQNKYKNLKRTSIKRLKLNYNLIIRI